MHSLQLGRVDEALSALADLAVLGDAPPDTHLYNLVLGAATKSGPPRAALTVYHRCAWRAPGSPAASSPGMGTTCMCKGFQIAPVDPCLMRRCVGEEVPDPSC